MSRVKGFHGIYLFVEEAVERMVEGRRLGRDIAQPFKIRLEFVGDNAKNVSGRSEKFWQLDYDHISKTFQRAWGRIHQEGAEGGQKVDTLSWDEGISQARRKLERGYKYAPITLISRVDGVGSTSTGRFRLLDENGDLLFLIGEAGLLTLLKTLVPLGHLKMSMSLQIYVTDLLRQNP